jgi:hypothetical protein
MRGLAEMAAIMAALTFGIVWTGGVADAVNAGSGGL